MDVGLFIIDNCIQLSFANGDFQFDDGLETAILISLFSDARVKTDELPPGVETKRGYWGDTLSELEGDVTGSKIWTLNRDKITNDTLAKLEREASESLSWMIKDGVAKRIIVTAEAIGTGSEKYVKFKIEITKPDNGGLTYAALWDGQEVKRA